MGDSCAPSRQLKAMSEYETLFFKDLLFRGYTVALTDYQGLGTPGTHTYMVREAQGHAVLDMARAAQRAGFPGTDTSTPIGLTGYSQGGGAVAAAAELAASYAPELKVKGTVAGAPPADMSSAVPAKIDGTLYSAFQLYATAGLFAAYHVDPASILNDKGVALLPRVEQNCVTGLFDLAFVKSATLTKYGTPSTEELPAAVRKYIKAHDGLLLALYDELERQRFARQQAMRTIGATLTKDGLPFTSSFGEEPLRSILADNRIGNRKPNAPVMITHSVSDDVIPYPVGKQLAKDWCAKGANVSFRLTST